MPWCDTCSAYQETVASDGETCPSCGYQGDETLAAGDGEEGIVGEAAPWHFWAVVFALATYLLWRAIAAVLWVIERT